MGPVSQGVPQLSGGHLKLLGAGHALPPYGVVRPRPREHEKTARHTKRKNNPLPRIRPKARARAAARSPLKPRSLTGIEAHNFFKLRAARNPSV